MPLPIRSVAAMWRASMRSLRIAPLRMKGSVLAHQAYFGRRPAPAELARGVDREQHRFGLALVGAELFVREPDRPGVIVLDEKIPCWRHSSAPNRSTYAWVREHSRYRPA